ncbi:trichoplein keratin filament-binding protein-like [Diadema setosum]|uniref:trichoplein keratin filament-binding protein-like n=1 Tax=Diadema setosum TaxID=31175 RepID=UPI003B3A36B4
MALPTLPSYWTSRYKNIHEKAMVQRRNHEEDFREQWSHRAEYFKTSEVQMVKQNAWTSDKSFHDSMDAFKSKFEREMKAKELQGRRQRLRRMLTEERNAYEAELRGLSGDNYQRLSEMKERSEGLKTSRETHRKQIADERLYDHWKRNNPDLRKLESDMHQRYVTNAWQDQREEREEQLASARAHEQLLDEAMERERLAGLELDRQRAESRLEEEKALAAQLQDQVKELKDREQEAARLKTEQDDLVQEQWELEKLEEERKELEEQRRKAEFGRVLVSQYKAKLRRRARQVQEALELDRKILESLAEKEAEEKDLQSARKQKAQADAAWMKQVIEEQLKLEKAREAELDTLFQEEAARQWSKREAEWEKERLARERLMGEVLQGRQEQLQDRMEENRQRQEESLRRREALLREMEVAQQLTQREKEDQEQQKVDTRRQLEAQMTERKERKKEARVRLQHELDAENQAERDYEEMLREEASRMALEDYEPKYYPRSGSRLTSRPESTVPMSSRPGSTIPTSRPGSRLGARPGSRPGPRPGPSPAPGAPPGGWRRPGPIPAWE